MTEKLEPLPVKGYTPQSADKVQLVNEHKEIEERLLRRIDAMFSAFERIEDAEYGSISTTCFDGRWLSIARTHFEEGFMALNRAVFKPSRVTLPEDNGASE